MIIIRIMGGLGNQMFQYALYEALKSQGKDVKIDLSWYSRARVHNGYELENVFHVNPILANKNESGKLGEINYSFLYRVYRKIIGHKKSCIFQTAGKALTYDDSICKLDEHYLAGYWQSEKYFENIKKQVLDKFRFSSLKDNANLSIAELIENSNSVSIHVRRGDYLGESYLSGVCNLEYYNKAITYFKDNIDTNLAFFVFSDDIQWCEQNFNLNNVVFVDHNKGMNSYIDMQLMSMCKHNIIANSTFSWWGAWLNRNPNKVVVAPSKWFNNINIAREDIIPKEWIKI